MEDLILKIILNSYYEPTSNEWFHLYDEKVSEKITIEGQHLMEEPQLKTNKDLNDE